MKVTADQLYKATITLMASYLTDESIGLDSFSDSRIKGFIDIAKRTADLIPDDKPKSKHNTGNLFINFPWTNNGVMRCELENWLRLHSGYTSNRAMQTIINNALAEGIIHKDIRLGKYFPGPDNSHS